jgi:hypothetical protein
MAFTFEGVREHMVDTNRAHIECANALWTFKYNNGYTVVLSGPLRAVIRYDPPGTAPQSTYILGQDTTNKHPNPFYPISPSNFKFEHIDFEGRTQEKSIGLEAIVGQKNSASPLVSTLMDPMSNGGLMIPSASDERRWEEPRIILSGCTMPGEPVNAFGIPQATMRCLEVCCAFSCVI